MKKGGDEGNCEEERGFLVWGYDGGVNEEGEVGGWKKERWLKWCLRCGGGWVVPAVVERRWLPFRIQLDRVRDRQPTTNRIKCFLVIVVFSFSGNCHLLGTLTFFLFIFFYEF